MSRTPVHERCTGNLYCPVKGHLFDRRVGMDTKLSHIRLTPGQRRTIAERRQGKPTTWKAR